MDVFSVLLKTTAKSIVSLEENGVISGTCNTNLEFLQKNEA